MPNWRCIQLIVFDFDGVFTNNKVYLDQTGKELVRCDRSDGLAFDFFRAFCKLNSWYPDCFILSKEKNPVVSERAEKLHVKCIQGISDKANYLLTHIHKNNIHADSIIYLGNDLNDLSAMHLVGFSIAPQDAHPLILQYANLIIPRNGGDGFVRNFMERLLRIESMDNAMISMLL